MTRDLRRQSVLLLIHIEGELRWFRTVGVEGQHVGAEAFGQHNSGVVFAGFRTFNGLIRSGHDPVELIIRTQLVENLVTHVDGHRQKIALVAGVLTSHRHFEIAGVIKRIPAGQHVEPREEHRNNNKANEHDCAHDIAASGAHVIEVKIQCSAH